MTNAHDTVKHTEFNQELAVTLCASAIESDDHIGHAIIAPIAETGAE